jgi:hypothetical protein
MPDSCVLGLIRKHRLTGVVVDSNLLLVYFIGLLDPGALQTFKRTQAFDAKDFEALAMFLAEFAKVVTTPAVLTEVSGLANQLHTWRKEQFFAEFKDRVGQLDEQHRPARQVCGHEHFSKCGFSDATIMSVAEAGLLVLTDDLPFCGFLGHRKVDYVNFNHIRDGWR